MIQNYFKITWRTIKANKVLSLLNVLGLTSGLFCFLLIYLWISSENSVNKYHSNIDDLYSVYVTSTEGANFDYGTPSLLYQELKEKIPEIESVAAMSNYQRNYTFSNSNGKIIKQKGKYVSEEYFNMFSFNIVEGSASVALKNPNDIAISKHMAELFFEDTKSAIGQTLTFENSKVLKVSMVYESTSENTTETSDFYLPFDSLLVENAWMYDWKNLGAYTFVQLVKDVDEAQVSEKLKVFLKDYGQVKTLALALQPYGDRYLYADLKNGGGKIEYVHLFGVIAFIIILIACINFMNLASAASVKRSKEIGVRKVLGAGKSSLIGQFLGESTILSFTSLFFALVFIAIALPFFNQITGKNIDLNNLPITTWFMVFVITLLAGVLSGSYPAFLVSSFQVTDIFKKKIETNARTKWIRKSLVIFQFTMTVIFISCMLIISKQINYIKNKDIGFERENLLAVTLSEDLQKDFNAFKTGALQISGVHSVTKASHILLGEYGTSPEVIWNGKSADDRSLFTGMVGSADFVKTYGAKLLMGRELIHNNPENIEYLINESAMKQMQMENPLGQTLSFWGNSGTIVGVVKDFHFSSLKEAIFPLIIRSEGYVEFNTAFIKYNKDNEQQTLASIELLHTTLSPAFPFEYTFIDDKYKALYKSESTFYTLSTYFSILAILISCLGLFGLVIFTAEQRSKEIGMRKVVGASVLEITSLITLDFLKLIVVGIAIGVPIAWYLMHTWLIQYEYRIAMPWWTFLLTGVIVIGISLVTVSFESIKIALTNPVKSLRNE